MSYVRTGDDSDVYVISTREGRYECCGCPQHPSRCTSFVVDSPIEIIAHLDQHREDGFKVPEHAYQRLRAKAAAFGLSEKGWVRKKTKWQLPRQLGLVRYASSGHHYGRAKREAWVPEWCARIARLPRRIEKRREILHEVATNPKKRAALEAAFEATVNVSDGVIFAIAEAKLA